MVATKTYDRDHLKSLTRAQIQALAKAQNIKANGKTATIIDDLLLKQKSIAQTKDQQDAEAAGTGAGLSGSKLPGTSQGESDTIQDVQNSSQKEPEVDVEAVSVNREFDSVARPIGIPSPEHFPRTQPRPSLPTSQRLRTPSLSPLPQDAPEPPVAGDETGQLSQAPVHSRSGGDIPPIQSAIEGLIPSVAQYTDKEVRALRRRLTGLVNIQANSQRIMTETQALLKYTEKQCNLVQYEANKLAFSRELVETSILSKLKEDRFLWDGTAQMNNKDDQGKWIKFVQKNWRPIKERGEESRKNSEQRAKAERRAAREERRAAGEEVESDNSDSTAEEDPNEEVMVKEGEGDEVPNINA